MTAALTIYDRMDNPLAAATQLGEFFHKSKIMGIDTAGDGVVLALTCMAENITPLDFVRKYHLVEGRPSMRADAMHAEFRGAGGRVAWLDTGDDGKEARATFKFDGQSIELAYTLEDAKKAVGKKFNKEGSNWQKDLSAMLRARLITKAVRMLAPELVAGVYSPDELDHVTSNGATRSKVEVAARREELAELDKNIREEVKADDPAPVDVPFEPTTTVDPDAKCTVEQLQELALLGDNLGLSLDEVSQGICSAADVTEPSDMTHGQALKMLANFQEALAAK